MNFQEKVFETTAELRNRVRSLVNATLPEARARLNARADALKQSLGVLSAAGRELNKVARTHTARFVKENSSLALQAGRDVSALAQSTYVTLTKRAGQAKLRAAAPSPRKPRAKRTRAVAKAA
jgi:hypothetical protein